MSIALPQGQNFWRVQKTVRPDEVTEYVYKATPEGLADCIALMQAADKPSALNCQDVTVSGMDGAVYTLKGQSFGDAKTRGTKQSWELVPPDVTMQGAFVSAPLCQAPKFGLGTKVEDPATALTVQQVQTVESLLRENGVVTQSALSELGTDASMAYAGWLMAGIKTFEAPSYVLQITHHIKTSKQTDAMAALKPFIDHAGEVVNKWDTIMQFVPQFLRPQQPTDFTAWLVTPATYKISIKEATATLTFIGAQSFPNFYTGGTRTPPSLQY